MLLKLGTGMMISAVAFAVVAAAIAVNLSSAEEPAASETAVDLRATGTRPVQESSFDLGEKIEIDDEPRQQSRTAETPVREDKPVIHERLKVREESPVREEPPAEPAHQPPEEPSPRPQESRQEEMLPVSSEEWTPPSQAEVAAASRPRHYPWREDAVFTLTIRALEIYNAPVLDSTNPEALSSGVVHVPETPMPWDGGQQKNVYLAGHRVGVPGTTSRVLFYHLDKISIGDSVVLKDRSGNVYRYRVSEIFVVTPDDGWVLDTVRDRDMVTLQTCTFPTFENRLIVRADRV